MKKKVLLVLLVLAVITAENVFAQGSNWYNSYAPGIEGSKILVNGGIGYGILAYKLSLPPISASVEYALANLPLSIGGYFGITGYNEELTTVSSYKGTLVGFGAKASYHFNFLRNLDPYVSLVLGWLVYNQEVTTTVPGNPGSPGNPYYGIPAIPATDPHSETTKYDLSTFYYGFNVGARYFFTKNIGAYVELGYSAVSVVSAGLSLKF
ncbi:MAG: hypothetical protein LBQ35_09065 [Spirochaetaceae bacterium]|jgi:hypothetical protein|nr:hypothetical protein [Spirochaetaceae bacterium]